MGPPVVSVLVASDRVDGSLAACLASLESQRGAPEFEVLVASSGRPSRGESGFPLRWIEMKETNPGRRRNAAARESRGEILAFLDDDAQAEPDWLANGASSLSRADAVGGPDPGPSDAPYAERLSDLLLATPWIGSGVSAHERNPRGGRVRFPHEVALCNLFVRRSLFERLGGFDESLGYIGEDTDFLRRALAAGARVNLDPAVRVRHRRRAFPAAYLAQRWRYRVKTGRLLVERPGLHPRGRVAAFLGVGAAGCAAALWLGVPFLLPAGLAYAAVTGIASFPIWRRDPALLPAVPFAFALHHATYFTGLLTGIALGLAARIPRGRAQESRVSS